MEKNNSIDANQIATKGDLAQATEHIIAFIKQSLQQSPQVTASDTSKKYLRTRDIKKMFGVSPNKLKDMRLKKEIPFVKKGKTFFYPEQELIQAMNRDLYPAKP